jgi:hypothetical protein
VLSCDVIIWDDNTPLFIFPENFTHSLIWLKNIFERMSPTVSSASEDPEAILEADSISMEDGTLEQNLEVSLL